MILYWRYPFGSHLYWIGHRLCRIVCF